MKKYIYFLLLAVLFTTFMGCGNKDSAVLSAEVKEAMEVTWRRQKGGKLLWDGSGYYGTYDGTVVFFISGDLTAEMNKEVAGETFWWPYVGEIYAYKDDWFYKLEAAYEKGFLTKKNIKRIAELHNEYLSEVFPHLELN